MKGQGRYKAGVDLGGTKIQVAITNRSQDVVGGHRCSTPTKGAPPDVAKAVARAVKAAANDAEVPVAELSGVGVGTPGQVNAEAGTVANAGNLPGWHTTYALGPELGRLLHGLPVALANDVQVAVNAEVHVGAGRPFDSLIGVCCGTGIGGGVVLHRELWLGEGAAGEIGHTIIQAKGGAPCQCGRHGCVEAYAGRGAMETQARALAAAGRKTNLFAIMDKKGRTRLTSGIWAVALSRGDKVATKLIDQAIWALGLGIANAVNLMDVEAVVIGGGLGCRLGQPFVDAVKAAMLPTLLRSASPPPVLLAALGDLGGAIGAALLVDELNGAGK